MKNLPSEIVEAEKKGYEQTQKDQPTQGVEEIMRIIQEARTPGHGSKTAGQASEGTLNAEADEESDVDVSGDYAEHA